MMVNSTKMLRKAGLNPHTFHEAIVEDNDDPRKLGRIRARIELIHDNIPKEHLPWSLPMHAHPDGAYNGERMKGDPKKWSGMAYIPKIKSKVLLKFMNGDPHFPLWSGYTIDEKTQLPETIKHYPNRCVFRFQNGAHMIIDTETNEIFLNNPGDVNMTVLGDLHQSIVGNHTTKVDSTMQTIPGYILNAPDTKLKDQSPHPYANPNGKIPFEGLYGHKPSEGHQFAFVKGDETMHVKGNRRVIIEGNDELYVFKNQFVSIGGNQTTLIGGHQTIVIAKGQDTNIMNHQTVTTGGKVFLN